jgi:hypothetical protein
MNEALRAIAALLVMAALAAPLTAAQVRKPGVIFKRSVKSTLPADPCFNKQQGVAALTTWFGSDASAVQQEVITFCTPELAEAGLARRVEGADIISGRRTETGQEVWAWLRYEVNNAPNDFDPSNDAVYLHYFRLDGREVLSLQGPDEEHIRLVLAELAKL